MRASNDASSHRCLTLLREARATRWGSDREAFLACRDPRVMAVTPGSLQRAFRDYFAVVLDGAHARHLAYALGGEDDEDRHVSYCKFAESIDSETFFDARRWRSEDLSEPAPVTGLAPLSPERSAGLAGPRVVAFNPIVSPPSPPPDVFPFDAEAADDEFREALLVKFETIAAAWLELDARRDGRLTLDEMSDGLRAHLDEAMSDDECARVFALYNARTDGPPRFSDFARRFSSSFMRAPLSSTAKAHVLRRAAAGIPTSPVRIDEAYLGGWFAAEPPRRAGPSWRRE